MSMGNSKFNVWDASMLDCFFFFFPTFYRLKTWLELSRAKLNRNDLRENKNYSEVARGTSYRGFALLRVNYSKCMTEIQGKSILVQVSARFELARV